MVVSTGDWVLVNCIVTGSIEAVTLPAVVVVDTFVTAIVAGSIMLNTVG